MYLAHYAPHLPLQAPKERVDACRERYKVGYDVLRKQRFERIRKNGLTDSEKQLPIFEREFRGKRPAGIVLLRSNRNVGLRRWLLMPL